MAELPQQRPASSSLDRMTSALYGAVANCTQVDEVCIPWSCCTAQTCQIKCLQPWLGDGLLICWRDLLAQLAPAALLHTYTTPILHV